MEIVTVSDADKTAELASPGRAVSSPAPLRVLTKSRRLHSLSDRCIASVGCERCYLLRFHDSMCNLRLMTRANLSAFPNHFEWSSFRSLCRVAVWPIARTVLKKNCSQSCGEN